MAIPFETLPFHPRRSPEEHRRRKAIQNHLDRFFESMTGVEWTMDHYNDAFCVAEEEWKQWWARLPSLEKPRIPETFEPGDLAIRFLHQPLVTLHVILDSQRQGDWSVGDWSVIEELARAMTLPHWREQRLSTPQHLHQPWVTAPGDVLPLLEIALAGGSTLQHGQSNPHLVDTLNTLTSALRQSKLGPSWEALTDDHAASVSSRTLRF